MTVLNSYLRNYNVTIRQQPERAKVSLVNERGNLLIIFKNFLIFFLDRRPIEPPPILQLSWENATEEELKKCLQSPFYFMVANLVSEKDPQTVLLPTQDYLSGTTVSSLHRLRDLDNSDGGFFVFGDLAVKKEGKFRLQFNLFEIVDGQVQNRKISYSNSFTVYLPKHFPGPVEATFLSRTFSDQGVKMRIRKEHRIQSRKRKTTQEHSIKKYQSKRSEITTSPPYAHSTHSSSSDVYFGRWQATPNTDKSRQAISPPLSVEEDYRALTNKFRYQEYSPESTYSLPHMKSPASFSLYPTRLPTPPSADYRPNDWGTRLPPLRAIMNNDHQHSLTLPPPITSKYLIEPRSL
ncbi:unnamed protein product [Rhizopus stolonifer]